MTISLSRRALFAGGAGLATAAALPKIVTPSFAAAPPVGMQAPGFYRFKVGDFEVTALHDGAAFRPVKEGFIKNAPLPEVHDALAANFWQDNQIHIPFTILAVNTGSKLVLIDTGFADNAGPALGQAGKNMTAAGLDPKNVDTVIISHFHPDHINGLRNKDGSAVYPNAEVMVPEAEWAFWMDDGNMSRAPKGMQGAFGVTRRVFTPIAKDVKPYRWNEEIVPGITTVDANGHTPGHTAFVIASGNGKHLVLSDTTNNPLIFARHPDWQVQFDMDGNQAVATRKQLLDMAAAERMRVSFYHAAFPATGFIAKQGNGYDFVPATWSSRL